MIATEVMLKLRPNKQGEEKSDRLPGGKVTMHSTVKCTLCTILLGGVPEQTWVLSTVLVLSNRVDPSTAAKEITRLFGFGFCSNQWLGIISIIIR